MTKRTGGSRRKTRYKFKKNVSERGRISIKKYLQKFIEGEKVVLKLEPSIHKGPYFRRYHGKTGTISRKRGSCYETMIKDNNKEKMLIIHPVHLTKISRNINK